MGAKFLVIDPSNPEPAAQCDRCGFVYNHSELVEQMEWRGDSLQPTGLRVCTRRCLDQPNPQNRTIILKPDPEAVENPRPER